MADQRANYLRAPVAPPSPSPLAPNRGIDPATLAQMAEADKAKNVLASLMPQIARANKLRDETGVPEGKMYGGLYQGANPLEALAGIIGKDRGRREAQGLEAQATALRGDVNQGAEATRQAGIQQAQEVAQQVQNAAKLKADQDAYAAQVAQGYAEKTATTANTRNTARDKTLHKYGLERDQEKPVNHRPTADVYKPKTFYNKDTGQGVALNYNSSTGEYTHPDTNERVPSANYSASMPDLGKETWVRRGVNGAPDEFVNVVRNKQTGKTHDATTNKEIDVQGLAPTETVKSTATGLTPAQQKQLMSREDAEYREHGASDMFIRIIESPFLESATGLDISPTKLQSRFGIGSEFLAEQGGLSELGAGKSQALGIMIDNFSTEAVAPTLELLGPKPTDKDLEVAFRGVTTSKTQPVAFIEWGRNQYVPMIKRSTARAVKAGRMTPSQGKAYISRVLGGIINQGIERGFYDPEVDLSAEELHAASDYLENQGKR